MKKPIPVNQEAYFNINEMFFSSTDLRGILEFGNEVFVRISAYPKNNIIGKAHNIIRHPDMPKAVFKIFWDTLKSGTPVAAYVKNMSSEGHYYWVFALAFPVKDGYLSIRFKPTSELFKTVQNLYSEILQDEKAHDMESGERLLSKRLKDLGFENYRQFMIHAALTELNSLDHNLISETKIEHKDFMSAQITRIKEVTVTSLNKSFHKIDGLTNSSHVFTERLTLLELEFKKLKMLSVNMSVLANKYGASAASLSVIAEYFSSLSNQIEDQLRTFSDFTHRLVKLIEQSTLEFAALKTQTNMVDFFVRESISKNAFDEMINTKDMFTSLFAQSAKSLLTELSKLINEGKKIGDQIFEIQKFINGLEIIKQIGAIESSREEVIKIAFDNSLKEMTAFNNVLKTSVGDLDKARATLSNNANDIRNSIRAIEDNIEMIFKMVLESQKKRIA